MQSEGVYSSHRLESLWVGFWNLLLDVALQCVCGKIKIFFLDVSGGNILIIFLDNNFSKNPKILPHCGQCCRFLGVHFLVVSNASRLMFLVEPRFLVYVVGEEV